MARAALFAIVLFAAMTPVAMRGDDKKPDGDKTPKSQGGATVGATTGVASGSREQFKGVLVESLNLIKALAADAAKAERELRPPTPAMFAMQLPKDLQCHCITAIGKALASTGDKAGARAALQSAVDAAGEVMTFGEPTKRAELYADIANAQVEIGEKTEAQFTLRQALQAARTISGESPFPIQPPPGMEFDYEPLAKKSVLLSNIANVQAACGETDAALETHRQAVEVALSLGQPLLKIRALTEIAKDQSIANAAAVWKTAFDSALAVSDEYTRAKAAEMVLRAMIKKGLLDEALATVADRLKGDAQNYALWVASDAISASDQEIPRQTIDRLKQLAAKAEFDRPSKKIKVFERIAQAQARVGDQEGAYGTAGEPHPLNNVQDFRATQARVNVMKAIAEAQIKAKQFTAAKDTIQAALEIFAPLDDEDAEAYFPLAALGDLQVKAGDLSGALETAKSLTFAPSRIEILVEIAVANSKLGRNDDARKMHERASKETENVARDALWRGTLQSSGLGDRFDPMGPVLQTIAHGQARTGDLDGALQTAGRINPSGFGKFTRKEAAEQIAAARLEVNDVPGARKAVGLVTDSETMFLDEKASMLERIAKHQAEKSDPAAALEWARKEEIPKSKLQILRGLAEGVAKRFTASEKASKPESKPGTAKPAN